MPLPKMTNKDDIDSLVAYLKRKPIGASIDEVKAGRSAKLVDGRKMNAYRTWGFITDSNNGDRIILTPRGREYGQASEEEKRQIFLQILAEQMVYKVTLEWIFDQGLDQIPASDVASHWYRYFRSEVGTDTEQSLNDQVTCFFGIAAAGGLGERRVGRKGLSTRLEINKTALRTFVEDTPDKDDDTVAVGKETDRGETGEVDIQQQEVDTEPPVLQVRTPNVSGVPSLHIDIQIHIASDATLEQIDKIFESMAKHLYKNNNN